MKYAIIADIHANLEAFQVVLDDIENQNADQIVCLGDVVGYNANPKECLKIVRDLKLPCVKGNHDEYCSTEDPLEGFNPAAASFPYQNTQVCFFGHTHVPVAFM
ncbi:MAG TPA: metallophosphoesterase family protein, partial [Candidatus Paceibacterota bacterium]|nr:metallophosphoesterase family protein [Candidatus Paceibacterota bacterium]